jgi:tRNA-2-methylthio-N6-dimethylallyladenosine synthase
MNEHDMEKVTHLLHVAGFEAADDVTAANVIIVNTCCVREKAEQKFYSFMGRLRGLKRKRGVILGVTGCIAQLEKDGILDRLPFIDFSLGPSSLHMVNQAIEAAVHRKRFFNFADNGCLSSLHIRPGNAGRRVKAQVTIMKGCNNFCSYCIVPFVRGREVSRASDDVLEEIRELASGGVKEVTLLGQNVNSYNKGREDLSFAGLLEAVNGIEGIERIRFVTSHPKDLSNDVIDCFGRLEKLCEHLHLPFQSGSNKILKLMNRGYTIEAYMEKIDRLRSRRDDLSITADCIVGFPGEDDQDFEETMRLIERVRFDGVFSFCFSPRAHTAAASLPDPIDRQAGMTRLHILQAAQKTLTRERHKAMEGSSAEVLVEGVSKNSGEELTGRTRTNRIINFSGAPDMVGKLVNLEVVKAYANSLRGADPKLKEA